MSEDHLNKTQLRRQALAQRKLAHEGLAGQSGLTNQLELALQPYQGQVLAGYMAIRSEINPRRVMELWSDHTPVCVPVVLGEGQALAFRAWTPSCRMEKGAFGAEIPQSTMQLIPQVMIVPLVAFDRTGGRLGYGGGFYDRTLEQLRARKSVIAIGFAYAAQECEHVPLEPTDQPLDAIVTEQECIIPQLSLR